LSASTAIQLLDRAGQLLEAISTDNCNLRLEDLAYTLQVGREAMRYRLALRVHSLDELRSRLRHYLEGVGGLGDVWVGEARLRADNSSTFVVDEETTRRVAAQIGQGQHDELLRLWTRGMTFDWNQLYGAHRPRRISLPTYPFARERLWIDTGVDAVAAESREHPLLHRNTSSLDGQRFSSRFTGAERFLEDHQIGGHRLLPGVAYLEMARAAVERSLEGGLPAGSVIRLQGVAWARPVIAGEQPVDVHVDVYRGAAGLQYEIYSQAAGGAERVHCEGAAQVATLPRPVIDLPSLRASAQASPVSAEQCYEAFVAVGIEYGPSHRRVRRLEGGQDESGRRFVLADLQGLDQAQGFVLHPGLVDSALHVVVALLIEEQRPGESIRPLVPFALEAAEIYADCGKAAHAVVRRATDREALVQKFDIDVCDASGNVNVRLLGLASRAIETRALQPETEAVAVVEANPPVSLDTEEVSGEPADLREKTVRYLKRLLSGTLKLAAGRIEADAPFEKYGIDSISALRMVQELESAFGSLSKTLLFEYRSIDELAAYFHDQHRERLLEKLGETRAPARAQGPVHAQSSASAAVSSVAMTTPLRRRRARTFETGGESAVPAASRDIAVVGVSGRYPQARDLREFWENLKSGRDSITEVPAERWDHGLYFDERKGEAGKTYSKWGGFLDGIDEFDPLFFNISPREAEIMDPQERLFLQCVYETLEEAGYTRHSVREGAIDKRVGVFVGVMYEEYQLYGAQAQATGAGYALGGSASSIANRVSYFCNFTGPSLAVDTMCSSSLTAIHLACQALLNGECEVAVAGGVNLSVHPNKYLGLAQGQFASSIGRCESFGEGGDGYVPGEGVGALLLKPLAQAIADGDRIQALIKGTSLNHGGKTNGYTVPNPAAQAQVISQALKAAKVSASEVSYIEAHGTGTSLGDPIEIAGLARAFGEHTAQKQFCAIGSVKSNIGHCESAAGVAGVTKVLLQMKHGQLVPSLHSRVLNPHIDFEATPFRVQQELAPWQPEQGPRIAGVSSFGAGGANAHVILQEYREPEATRREPASPASVLPTLVLLSGRDEERLRLQAKRLLEHLERGEVKEEELPDLGYTLQVGREALEHRLAMAVRTLDQLKARLNEYLDGQPLHEDCCRGEVTRQDESVGLFAEEEDLKSVLDSWIGKGRYAKLLELWVKGLAFDWRRLYGEHKPRRLSLPAYPFDVQKYWIEPVAPAQGVPGREAKLPSTRRRARARRRDFDAQFYSSILDELASGKTTLDGAMTKTKQRIA
jgi:acyl transferase domain-containing protein/acyl carrier protein